MTLLDVINLDKILAVNSMWENTFFERMANGVALVWKLWKNQNEKKCKLWNMMGPNFFYTNIILLLFTKETRIQSFTFYKEFFFGPFHSN